MNAFHVWGYEVEGNGGDTSADRPRITVASDLSLDEGAIIRTVAGASILSSGTEYFLNLQRREATLVLDALNELRESLSVNDHDSDFDTDEVDMIKHRVERLLSYID